MKFAVIISGLLRQPEESFDLINKSFVIPHDSDVFIYSWVKEEKDNHLNNNYQNSSFSKKQLLEFSEKYFKKNLKKIVLENYEEQAETMKGELGLKDVKNIPYRFFPQSYKLYKVNELRKEYQKENNFTYDIIISVRTELFYPLPIQEEVIEKAKEGTMCFCAAADYGGLQTTLGVLNNENSNKYCDMFIKYRDDYLKNQFSFFCNKKNNIDTSTNSFRRYKCPILYKNNILQLNSEYLYGYHMQSIGCNNFFRFPYSCGIKISDMKFRKDDPNISSFEYYIDPGINYIRKLGELPFQGQNLRVLEENINNNSPKFKGKFFYWAGRNGDNKKLLELIKDKYNFYDIEEDYIEVSFNIPLKENLNYKLRVWRKI